MNTQQWKPEDFAMVRLDADTEIPAIRTTYGDWLSASGAHYDPNLTARPLVVLDPENAATVNDLARALNDQLPTFVAPAAIQAALRSLVTPPRPTEPTGLGAVVEDTEGTLWFRMALDNETWPGEVWQEQYGEPDRWSKWADLSAVRVLSEGVTP